jgi:hypothetical protein
MGLISASQRSWLTFVPEGSRRGQQQNLVPRKITETLLTMLQMEYDLKSLTLRANPVT